ncbi:NAD(P)-dependent oxidoreductase [Variovorax sp. WS11]|uniref:NAD(P)-dependent oxidoreductase n=1 Tax=Variovorax sp. WS11 TaxID=1105204 RepID=UPI000D0D10B0|nr:NAD(P)-dependent oxidoreductase [Variovorax sp. WS11]NDZ18865.1 NAD(P)-dependent oxidoreductase [Variovorax sp. WS11]PSL79080.1 NAD(P)-dependent oxidoreductase [Variovorax sp. WS11]
MSDQLRTQTVGFIGLGMMGLPMATNLLKKGHKLVAYDIDARALADVVRLGAKAGEGPADVASQASVVISMVDTTAQAEEVIVGAGGVMDRAQQGDIVVSMSTIDPVSLRAMHKTLAAKGIGLIDVPVSGQVKGAIAGTLKASVGGELADLEKARPALASMTSEIVHFGSIGQGTVMKLINNLLSQVTSVVVAEALVLGTKAGLDPTLMVDSILKSTGNSAAFEYGAPRILKRDFKGIRMDIVDKDLELQVQLAKSFKVPLFMTNIAHQIYQAARAQGLGSEDYAASIVKVYENITGVVVKGK